MKNDISLHSGIRYNLLTIKQTDRMLQRTTNRLSTGRKVNSPIDNPTSYFVAENFRDRSKGLSYRLDGIGQAINTIQSADNGIKAVRELVAAMLGKVDEAIDFIDSERRVDIGRQFNQLLVQTQLIAQDSDYKAVNLMQHDAASDPQVLTIQFDEDYNNSTLTISGFDLTGPDKLTADGLAIDATSSTARGLQLRTSFNRTHYVEAAVFSSTAAAANLAIDWSGTNYKAELTQLMENLEDIDYALQVEAKSLSTSLVVVTVRQDFTEEEINLLEGGADKLVLADLNEEGANLLSLQTSQSMGIQALAMSSQAAQGVLRLFG